jgi:hypothetical protein
VGVKRSRAIGRRAAYATSTEYRKPYRPRIIRLANRVIGALTARRVLDLRLDEAALIEAAESSTGLLDLGDPSFRAPLRVLLRSIEQEARLHPLGRVITRARLVSALATRMRLEELYRRQPAIERERLARPIVIVGLPRTGTTLLHRLLASDPRIRSLASWEALRPVPMLGDAPAEDDRARRIVAAERSEAALAYMAPDFFAVHPIDARAPEEDVLLLDLAFRSTVPESTLRVPSYAAWLEGEDQGPAYRYMARVLRALQWQRSPDAADWRWVLKTPHHLEWLEEVTRVLPDPLFVWAHRDPREIVPSFCSMLAHGRGVFSEHVDPHEIGRSWLRKGQRMVERAIDARARLGEGRFVDVRYADLIRDPIGVVKTIEERAGLAWTKDVETRAQDKLRREVKDRHGIHRYALSDFGLAEHEVARTFERYRTRFALGQ